MSTPTKSVTVRKARRPPRGPKNRPRDHRPDERIAAFSLLGDEGPDSRRAGPQGFEGKETTSSWWASWLCCLALRAKRMYGVSMDADQAFGEPDAASPQRGVGARHEPCPRSEGGGRLTARLSALHCRGCGGGAVRDTLGAGEGTSRPTRTGRDWSGDTPSCQSPPRRPGSEPRSEERASWAAGTPDRRLIARAIAA